MEAFLNATSEPNCHVLRLVAPESLTSRTPTHFILLIDTSESMADDNKLANVKHSASLVLNFLGPLDQISIVTFGDKASIYCRAVPCDLNQKSTIHNSIDRIRTDGCTNLSAGLIAVREILGGGQNSQSKTGLLLLTDGHANRGVSRPERLEQMLSQIHGEFPALSISLVGYGLDHNVDLLKDMAEKTQGTYSIVEDKEGAASVIGNMLGSLFSCAAQQMVVRVPPGTAIEGTQFQITDNGEIPIGDLYEGNETLLLLRGLSQEAVVRVEGYELPSLRPIRIECAVRAAAPIAPAAQLHETINLTRLRYTIAAMFRELRHYRSGSEQLRPFEGRIEALERDIGELMVSEANQNVKEMLLAECESLKEAVRILIQAPWAYNNVMMQTSQHEAFNSTGRGLTQRISLRTAAPRRNVAPLGVNTTPERYSLNQAALGRGALSAEEDPSGMILEGVAPPEQNPQPSNILTSPYSSRAQRDLTSLMASMSMAGVSEEDEHEEEM